MDIIVAGTGDDTVNAGDGHDLVCGDLCFVQFMPGAAGSAMKLDFVVTVNQTVGGMRRWHK